MMLASEQYANSDRVARIISQSLQHLRIPEKLLPSEWAERKCRIPSGNKLPGPIRFRNAPYQREPLDMCDSPDVLRISLMWGAQTGKSQVQLMAMGYFIDHDPQSIMHMQPSETDLKTWLNAKFDPMVESTPTLKDKIATPRGREGVNNQIMKSYPGGFLMFSWSGSPKTTRGRSAPKIFPDETDGYERTSEGHPVSLLWQRAATFGDERLLFETSTPTIKGASYIEDSFEQGDMRRWFCECPDCCEKQYLKWSQVRWHKDDDGNHQPNTAVYVCEHCEAEWDDGMRFKAISDGVWLAEKPFSGHVSYHLTELCSMFRELKDIVQSFLDKKKINDLQTFVNVSLAETWEEEGDSADHEDLMQRQCEFAAQVPEGCNVLVASADIQKDRAEIKVKGFGVDEESWNIDYKVIYGDPTGDKLYGEIDEYLNSTFKHESGVTLSIGCAVIDSGNWTDHVYRYVKGKESRRIFAIKGKGGRGIPILNRGTRSNKYRIKLFTIGTDSGKDLMYRRLGITEPGPGYVHFSNKSVFDEEYFLQLCSEKKVTRFLKGVAHTKWMKKRARNEAADLELYCIAALYIWGPKLDKLASIKSRNVKPKNNPSRNSQSGSWVNGGDWI